jgi:hypothetical protein
MLTKAEIRGNEKMKRESRARILSVLVSICLSFVVVANASGEDYEALKGLKSVMAVFDVRINNPKSAALHLQLIHETFKDKNLTAVEGKPTFVVVFVGPSVRLISNREGFSPKNIQFLMSCVQFQICQGWNKVRNVPGCRQGFGVDPASVFQFNM